MEKFGIVLGIILYLIVFVVLPLVLSIISIKDYYTCNEHVVATFKGYERTNIKGVISYYPKFTYDYDNEKYTSTSRRGLNEFAAKNYEYDKEYTILLNRNNPHIFVTFKSKSDLYVGYLTLIFPVVFLIIFLLNI